MPLQVAAAAGHLAGIVCGALLDWLAPIDKPAQPDTNAVRESRWPLQEPEFTDDERVGLRQLLDERFGLALRETAEQLACVDPMPGWFRGGFDDDSSAADGDAFGTRDCTAAESPVPADFPAAGAGHSKVTEALLICAGIGLREYAEHRDCEAPTYWRNVADQLDPKK